MNPSRPLPSQAVCVTGLERSFPEFSMNLRASLETLLGARGADGRLKMPLERVADWFGVRPASDPWATVRVALPPLRTEAIQTSCNVPLPPWFSAYARSHSARHQFAVSFVQSLCDLAVCEAMISREERRRHFDFFLVVRLRLDLAWETALLRVVPLPNTVHITRMNSKGGFNDKFAYGARVPMRAYLTRMYQIPVANLLYNKSHPLSGSEEMFKHTCLQRRRSDLVGLHSMAGMMEGYAAGSYPEEAGTRVLVKSAPPESVLICSSRNRPMSNQTTSHSRSAPTAWQSLGIRAMKQSKESQVILNDDDGDAVGSRDSSSVLHLRRNNSDGDSRLKNYSSKSFVDIARQGYARVALHVEMIKNIMEASHISFGRKFTLTSEAFLKWSLWLQNVDVALESSWMFCKFSDATNFTARTCVPRMRQQMPCMSLICPGHVVDCRCLNSSCTHVVKGVNTSHWYCEEVNGYNTGIQLSLMPIAQPVL